jgi:3-oxoacyl-[acyl-carrier protein] reductase
MDLGIAGRVALVLGGTQGLGLACAESLAAAGVKVVVNARTAAGWQANSARLAGAAFAPGDVGVEADRRAIVAAAERVGTVSILVTNAGGPPTGRFEEIEADAWRRAFETNVLGMLDIARALLPKMRVQRFGRIVNVTSFVVKELYPNMSLSNSLRVALTGAMGSLARECAADGVTVNGILPGLMDTGALQRVFADRSKRTGETEAAIRASMAAGIPMQRLGTAADFGPLCAFLASTHAGYITGQNICVDGGLVKAVI